MTFRIEQNSNGTFIASLVPEEHPSKRDDLGALYYVVVVIFLYGCSILMMIASYIRKNKDDRRLKRYLKEMAFVRKRELRMSLLSAAKAASRPLRLTPVPPSPVPEQISSGHVLEQKRIWVRNTSLSFNIESSSVDNQRQRSPAVSNDNTECLTNEKNKDILKADVSLQNLVTDVNVEYGDVKTRKASKDSINIAGATAAADIIKGRSRYTSITLPFTEQLTMTTGRVRRPSDRSFMNQKSLHSAKRKLSLQVVSTV